MIRGMTLVTTALAALGLSATPARPASATPGAARRPNVAVSGAPQRACADRCHSRLDLFRSMWHLMVKKDEKDELG